MNFLETTENDDSFAYFDVQNLSVDHSLIMSEIEEYKDLIFSPNSLHQIYFKNDADVETIELIKNLLSISEYVDDSKIEKYVLLRLSKEDVDKLLKENYENPSTWKLPYEIEDDCYTLTDIPNYRTMNAFIDKIRNNNYSPVELIMKVYDEVKLMDYIQDDEEELLPEIIIGKKANSFGMNKLFSYILSSFGFKTFMGETVLDGNKSYVTLVGFKDTKYNICGIYLFDPSMDTLSKEVYKSDSVRKINYNFFLLPLSYMTRLKYDEKLQDLLNLLAIEDTEFSKEKVENSKANKIKEELKKLTDTFGVDYEKIHNTVKTSKRIDIDTIIRINDAIYSNKNEKYNQYLKQNYNIRKDDLFFKESEEEIKDFIKEEKNK